MAGVPPTLAPAVPHQYGWNSIDRTVTYSDDSMPQTRVRLLIVGNSHYTGDGPKEALRECEQQDDGPAFVEQPDEA